MASNTQKKHRWSIKYKRSINCNRPRGFSQKQYCKYGRKTKQNRKNNKLKYKKQKQTKIIK